jgi:hypothetical protein
MSGRELISQRTREAVRDQVSDIPLRDIDEMWQDELFAPSPDPDPEVRGQGQRVARFQSYLDLVDWTDPTHVLRALRVFEVALHNTFHIEDPFGDDEPTPTMSRLRRLFERDGYTLTNDGKLVGVPLVTIAEGALSNVTDPAVILEHLDRIDRAKQHDDPAQAIGSAKELIESTAKLILSERGVEFSDREDLPELTKKAQSALLVHPTAAPAPDGNEGVRRILGAVTTVAAGVAELRNRGLGTGHGPGVARTGLGARHANLAVHAARLWCEFMLDTLGDPAAPWRRTRDTRLGPGGVDG